MLGIFIVTSIAVPWHWMFRPARAWCHLWQLASFTKDHHGMKLRACIWDGEHCYLLLPVSREDCNQISAPQPKTDFPAASSWGSESCLEQRVNSWQEAIKVSFIHSHYCFYVFAIMFIDMFERSTSCSSVQLPVKMGHLSRNKPRSF